MVQGLVTKNEGNTQVTVTSTFSGSYTRGASATGTLSAGWGPINASVGYDADTSVEWSASEALSQPISPGYEGWIDYGTSQNEWYGSYYYLNSSCGYTNDYMDVYSPKVATDVVHSQPIS